MAQKHVWCYTLRLFHTFAVFENNRKINANRDPKINAFGPKMALERSRVALFIHLCQVVKEIF